LEAYGLPNAPQAYVASSSSGYMNEDLFRRYLKKVFFPGIKAIRRNRKLKEEPSVLMMDGFSGHTSDQVLKLLQSKNIIPLWLVPHSSHLCQPLDLVIFSTWKRLKKSCRVDNLPTTQAVRLLRGLRSLDQATDFHNVIASFRRAGFTANNSFNPPTIDFDINVILSHERAPENDQKQLLSEPKKNGGRLSLPRGMSKGEKEAAKQQPA